MISDIDVEKLELDQRRAKSAPDNKRGEIIARIVEMREIEKRLANVRAYVGEWELEEEAAEVLAILNLEWEAPKYAIGHRPDRRKRRIVELYHRVDVATVREKKLLELVQKWIELGDADAEDIKRILEAGHGSH